MMLYSWKVCLSAVACALFALPSGALSRPGFPETVNAESQEDGPPIVHTFLHNPKTAGTSFKVDLLDFHSVSRCDGLQYSANYSSAPSVVGEFIESYDATLNRADPTCNFVTFEGGPAISNVVSKWGKDNGYQVKTLTFLREPVTRAISGIEHVCRRHSENGVTPADMLPLATLMALREGRTYHGYRLLNPTTHFLSDHEPAAEAEQGLPVAMRELEAMEFVGITEHYAESLCVLSHLMGEVAEGSRAGCKDLCAPNASVGTHSNTQSHLKKDSVPLCSPSYSLDDIKLLSRQSLDDIVLYGYAVDLFKQSVKRVEAETGWRLLCHGE